MNAASLDYVGKAVGITIDAESKDAAIVGSISARMAEYCGRDDWGPQSSRTEYFDGGTTMIAVGVWPIVSVASVYDDVDHDWPTSSLVEAADYFISQTQQGVIYSEAGTFNAGTENLKVTYVGGYASEDATPDAVKRALVEQFRFERMRNNASGGITIAGEPQATPGLLPVVTELLRNYRRRDVFA